MIKKCECCGTARQYFCRNAINYPVLCVGCSIYSSRLRRKVSYLKRRVIMLEKRLYGLKHGGPSIRDEKMKKLLK